MKKRLGLSTSIYALTVVAAFAWGQKGHDSVAFIAENHLTSATKAAIDSILGGKSIVYWSNWLDNASHTPEYAYTKTWHYKNIDSDQSYENVPPHKDGDVVTMISQQVNLLNSDADISQKELALKILVHLMGDLHQPMHMGHASDLGGNRVAVKTFGNKSNLHSAWDSWVVEQAHKWSFSEWQQQIDRIPEEQIALICQGDPYSWGKETHNLATLIYATTPEDSNLSFDYVAQWSPFVEEQILKGGLRLADVLNSIFDNQFIPSNTIQK